MILDKQKHLEGVYRQVYLEGLYKKVVNDFPEINEEEIEIKYDPLFPHLKIVCYLLNKKKSKIEAGIDFFDDSREEQEACIAHEIGHHIENQSITRLKHSIKLILQKRLSKWQNGNNYLGRRKLEVLQNYYTIKEISADNWAVKKGYTAGLLKILNKLHDELDEANNIKLNTKEKEKLKFNKEYFTKRIANIEQKIKEK